MAICPLRKRSKIYLPFYKYIHNEEYGFNNKKMLYIYPRIALADLIIYSTPSTQLIGRGDKQWTCPRFGC